MQDLSAEQIQDLEQLLRLFRRRTPVVLVGIVIMALTLAIAIFAVVTSRYDADATRFNANTIASLSRELTIERQQANAQARLYSGFLNDFTAQQDYVCRVAAAFAALNGLEPPKTGLCAVTIPVPPTPAPAPTSSPSPSPSAPARGGARPAPSAPRPVAGSTLAPPVSHGRRCGTHHCPK